MKQGDRKEARIKRGWTKQNEKDTERGGVEEEADKEREKQKGGRETKKGSEKDVKALREE